MSLPDPAPFTPRSTSSQHAQTASSQPDACPSAALAWYVVHTKPRQEHIALDNLQRQGYACYLPYIRVERVRRRQAMTVREPMFPRYLFIQLDSSEQGKSWSPIRSTLGVTGLVRFGARAAKVDDALIALLRQREQDMPVAARFQRGDAVVITEGAFAGIEAIFQTADAQHRAIILLDILSQSVPMQMHTGQLRKAD